MFLKKKLTPRPKEVFCKDCKYLDFIHPLGDDPNVYIESQTGFIRKEFVNGKSPDCEKEEHIICLALEKVATKHSKDWFHNEGLTVEYKRKNIHPSILNKNNNCPYFIAEKF